MIIVQNNELDLSDNMINVLYFSATWCGPCKILKPVMGEISTEMSDKIKTFYIDINENTDLLGKYGVMSVPTLIMVKNDTVMNKIVGVQPKTNIVHAINEIN